MLVALLASIASFAQLGSELAYVASEPPRAGRVFVVALDTGASRPVGPEGATGAAGWSPDGNSVALTIESPGGRSIYIAEASGEGGYFIRHLHADCHDPAWSRDGTRLAYAAGRGLDSRIVVYEPATGQETLWGGGRTSLSAPRWSSVQMARTLLDPEEREALAVARAFQLDESARDLLIAVGLKGSTRLTTDIFVLTENDATPIHEALLPSAGDYSEFDPAISPDALAFESNDGGDREIFIVTRRRTFDLSNHRAADWNPEWAPDGRTLAFQSFRGGRSGIYRCAPRRASQIERVVAFDSGDCWGHTWSPDSQWIAFAGDFEGDAPAVYVVRADGSGLRRISAAGTCAESPAWRPQP